MSKQFFELVKAIGESKSKQEEDRIITKEVDVLKEKFGKKSKPAELKEYLVRLMYCEMLGHDGSFGYIHAVQLSARDNLIHKKTAYLACAQMLRPEHELRFMMVNQMQRDLQSLNHLQICTGLIALAKLGTKDMIPAMVGLVATCLKNDEALVRKKAIMVMHRFSEMDMSSVEDYRDHFRRTLCDKDPSVMGSALHVLSDLAENDPLSYKDLVPSYVSILKQITEHRLPKDYDYHRMPAPWIQIKLLKILAILGAADQTSSEGMYEVILEVMRRADTGINVGYAIIYECVKTITAIYPNNTLLDAAAAAIGRFIASNNHNLRYLGITGLASIVADHPRYAAKHQLVVMDCLEDPDETLRRKTLELLHKMTNPVNVEMITGKMIEFLKGSNDEFLRKDLTFKITGIAERYAPSNEWYVQTMTTCFLNAGEFVQESTAHTVIRLIAEGSGGEDDEADEALRAEAVETFLDVIETEETKQYSNILIYVMAWVLGEYAYVLGGDALPEICDKLVDIGLLRSTDTMRKGYVMSGLTKLTAQLGGQPTPATLKFAKKYLHSRDTVLSQRCFEFLELIKHPAFMQEVLPVDASCEDIEVDENLSFLDDFVQMQRDQGMPEYNLPEGFGEDVDVTPRTSGADTLGETGLRYEAYSKPTVGDSQVNSAGVIGGAASLDDPMAGLAVDNGNANNLEDAGFGGGLGAGGPWGAGGHAGLVATANEPEPAKAPMEDPRNSWGGEEPSLTGQVVPAEQPAAPQTVSAAPVPDPVVSEREKMAAALFGGIVTGEAGASSGANTVQSRREARRARRANRSGSTKAAAAPASTPVANDTEDLLGVGTVDVSNSGPPEAAFGGSDDLLGLAFGGETAAAPARTSAATDDMLDIFGGMGGQPSSAPAASSAVDDLLGAFGGMTAAPAVSYLLNPAAIDTPTFGASWGTFGAELKVTVPSAAIRSPVDFMNAMTTKANLQGIQAIAQTSEAICAGTSEMGQLALVHGKILPGSVLLTVRTQDPGLTQKCLEVCQQALM